MPRYPAQPQAVHRLSPSQLHNQWIICREEGMIPAEWQRAAFGQWRIGWHESTRICSLRSADGRAVGWLIAPLLYRAPDGRCSFPESEWEMPLSSKAEPWEFERVLYGRDQDGLADGSGMEGHWIAALSGGAEDRRFQRVYLSPTNSLVFSREQAFLASTANAAPLLRRNVDLSEGFDPIRTNRFYSFGLTPFEGLRRLLPNHFLDLDTFETRRHWPRAELPPLSSGREGAERVAREAQALVAAVSQRYDEFRVFLSAGNDSRAVLAIARGLAESGKKLSLITTYGTDLGTRTDLQAARKLAKIARLPHRVRKLEQGERRNRLDSFAKIGEARGGTALDWSSQAKDSEDAERFNLAGMAGEVGRAVYWKRRGAGESPIDPRTLAKRLNAPDLSEVIAAAEAWLDGLPEYVRSNAAETLDFAYLEQRLGCWYAPARYLSPLPGGPRSISPMMTSLCLETMLRLPLDYRAQGLLQRDMVDCAWPDLLAVPFNEPTGLLKLHKLKDRAVRKVARLWRRLPIAASPASSPFPTAAADRLR